ncbi:MAG: LPS assembly protein LptD, partial [Pseudomonadota bacterium]|nr:LPS assembly protein LptD [Pseudomonadota bacterium]
MSFRFHTCIGLTLAGLLFASPTLALEPVQKDQPVLLQAEQLDNDEKNRIITATGNVELSQGDRLLQADRVTWNQQTGVVAATGHVRILEPTGEIVFAEHLELTEDLKNGFVNQIRVRLTDDSRLAASSGMRKDGVTTEFRQAVYSPCKPCEDNPEKAPLWQLKADRVEHSTETHDIVYRDAWMEMFGVPVLYTPYFSHPDPTVERRSGFLAPTLGYSSDLGYFARTSYYFDIAPSMDTTLEAGWSQEDGPLLGGEWRQRFENGKLKLKGALVYAEREEINDASGISRDADEHLRGYIFAEGLFDLDENWRAGFDINRTTDDSFLRRYNYSSADILESRAFAEGFYGRDYIGLNAYDFQDLRPGEYDEEPLVLPLADASFLGDPGSFLGGRWSFYTGTVGLIRDSDTDTGRFSADAGWQREWVTGFGLVTTVDAHVRADAWYTQVPDEGLDPFTSEEPEQWTARFFPQAQIMARYPFVSHGGIFSQLIEPVVAYT